MFTAPARTGRRFRPEVQGLRAVAVLLVLAYHLDSGLLPGGYVGVDVFFVISGFLITSLLYREATEHDRVSISGFYVRRVRR
ncbi:acyltransferase family protein, partial [Nocardiopsis halotolerans]|uniref:acyltransferase family protein n=1 Tax=Nocardiopsis halotolerans TaxID=124252 RepID=UPI000372438B